MTGSYRPVTVMLALLVFGLLIVGVIMAAGWMIGRFADLDTRLLATLMTALAVVALIVLGLRSASANGERRVRWELRLHCYRRLLEDLSITKTNLTDSAEVVLIAGPGVIKTLARLQRLSPTDPTRRTALLAVLRELRRDLGQSSRVLSEAELLGLLERFPDNNPELK